MSLETNESKTRNTTGTDVLSEKLHDHIYKVPNHLKTKNVHGQTCKSQIKDQVLDESNGVFYDVPKHLKPWLDNNRLWIDTRKDAKFDGVITTNELRNSSDYFISDKEILAGSPYFASNQNTKHVDDLLHHIYSQRFKLTGDAPVVDKFLDTTYKLPKQMQEWVNQNSHKLDGVHDKPDGVITPEEICQFSDAYNISYKDNQIYGLLKQLVLKKAGARSAMHESFVKQVAKDPESLKSWFDQHKNVLDTNNDNKVCVSELYNYGTKTKLDAHNRTMLVGLGKYSRLFAHDAQKKDPEIRSDDIDTAIKLMSQKITPTQIAWDNTANPTKIGAALGALSGGAMGLGYAAPLASSAYASWGALTAGSIGTCAAITASGALAGALIGTAAIGGAAYGINYFAAKDWYEKRTRAYSDLGWIK